MNITGKLTRAWARRAARTVGAAVLALAASGVGTASGRGALPDAPLLQDEPILICADPELTDRGKITGVLDLPPGTYHVLDCSLKVETGGTLNIPAGVTMLFADRRGLDVDGTLRITGSSPEDVLLTSDQEVKSRGDWPGIRVSDKEGAQADIQGATIEYASSGIDTGAMGTRIQSVRIAEIDGRGIEIDGASATIGDAEIEGTAAAGIEISENRTISTTVSVSTSSFRSTGEPAAIHWEPNVGLTLAGNSAEDNFLNAVLISGSTLDNASTWSSGDFPYVVSRSFSLRSALTLASGTVLKFGPGGGITADTAGRLSVEAADGDPVLFTSLADDACSSDLIDCDTNNDGDSFPSPGAWKGITFDEDSNGGGISNAQVHYAETGVTIRGVADVAIENSEFSKATLSGIAVTNVDATITGNTFSDLAGTAIDLVGDVPIAAVLSDNSFERCGVVVATSDDVELEASGNTVEGFTNGLNGYRIRGEYTRGHVWRAGDLPFVVAGDLQIVNAAAELRIEPGAVVKFAANANIEAEQGRVVIGAAGPESERVLVTSLRDDACSAEVAGGCDTNGDGGDTLPGRGDWGWLEAQSTSRGIALNNVELRYGGTSSSSRPTLMIANADTEVRDVEVHSGNGAGIEIENASPVIDGAFVHDNAGAGLIVDGGGTPLSVALSNTRIENNGQDLPATEFVGAVEVDANVELVLDGTNRASRDSRTSRQLNGIVVSGIVRNSLTWRAGRLPYVVLKTVDVQLNKRLTLDPGVVVKFGERGLLTTSRGTLQAVGTEEAPIILTSVADAREEAGGVTDPSLGDPAAGDWGGLQVNRADLCQEGVCARLEHIEVRYSGRGNAAAISVEQPDTLIRNVLIEEGMGAGIFAEDANGVEVYDTQIRNMSGNGIEIGLRREVSAEVTLQRNRISGTRAAVRINPNVQARLGLDADGTGNTVEGNVINGIVVDGRLSTIKTFTPGDLIYVVESELSLDRGTLKLEPGTVLKAGLEAEIRAVSNGGLQIQQEPGKAGVLLTSLRHDACGLEPEDAAEVCDTNGDGDRTSPDVGNWTGLRMEANAGSAILEKVHLLYAGRTEAALFTLYSRTVLRDSTIRYSLSDGAHVQDAGNVEISGNLFADNVGTGLRITGDAAGLVEGNVFTGNARSVEHRSTGKVDSAGNVAIGNEADAMLVCAPVRESQTWASDLAREIACDVDIESNSDLEIEPGSLIRFSQAAEIAVNSTTLRAQGVVFTAEAGQSTPGFWRGITFGPGTRGHLSDSIFAFGGGSNGAVELRSSGIGVLHNTFLRTQENAVTVRDDEVDATIEGNFIRDVRGDRGAAIFLRDSGTSTVKHNRIAEASVGIRVREKVPAIRYNNLAGVSGTGVINEDDDNCIDAEHNWWGDPSGPTDTSEGRRDGCEVQLNLDGKGLPVSDYVDYMPWLAVEPPSVPVVELPRCGYTSSASQTLVGRAASGSKVRVYDRDTPIAEGTADASGAFSVPLPALEDGEHRLSVETYLAADGVPEDLRSPRTGFRRVIVDAGELLDPASIAFEYGPSGSTRVQPLRDETGCASACGGPSAGRVTLSADVDVRVRVRATGSPSAVSFVQEGHDPIALRSEGGGVWRSEAFRPQPGTFTLRAEGGGSEASFCDGYVFIGGSGRVFADEGAPGEPLFREDFESGDDRWDIQPTWDLTTEKSHSGSFSLTDSPGGNYLNGVTLEARIREPLDLRSSVAPVLRFWHWHWLARRDEVRVEARICSTCEWEVLRLPDGNEAAWREIGNLWKPVELPLAAYQRQPRVYLRWLIEANAEDNADGWYIDDVSVSNGGVLNGKYETGESLIEGARVTLFRRNPDTGAYVRWDATPTGQANPQITDSEGRYGFFFLAPGEYRVMVEDVDGMEPFLSDPAVILTGTFDVDVPLKKAAPIYLPVSSKAHRW